MSGEASVTLGEIIAHFRQRLRRPSGLPWSQEDLAFAVGADQAHISRIESNRLHPQYSTLTRICDVLDLSRGERRWVLALAGHQEIAALPERKDVAQVLAELVPRLESFSYPAMLNDEGERLWYYNRLAVALLGTTLGIEEHAAFLERIRGKLGMLELIYNSDVYKRWKTYWENADDLLTRWIALLWRVYRIRQHDPHMARMVALLKTNPELLGFWEQIERGDVDILFVEQGTYALRHPKLGRAHFHTWRTHFAEDERFFVTHCTPMDSATSKVFERLSRDIAAGRSKDPLVPCSLSA
jgi:transcriptional regulator with XRE-family HTH domain